LETLAQQAWLQRDLGRPLALVRTEAAAGSCLEFVDGGATAAATHPSGMTHSSLLTLINRTGGNKARVARNLGVSRVTLYRWLQQLDQGAM
jgi:transcriptional regulator of acetoin/glycerol metabolism